jgi:hypothetical protein
MRRLGALLLAACATTPPTPEAPAPQPVFIGPSMTQKDCDLTKYEGRRFEVDMRAVELEKALRGIADCTCLHFELQPGAKADITIPPQPKPVNADELFALFEAAVKAQGISLQRKTAAGAWPATYVVR